jgi:hypothetical protein
MVVFKTHFICGFFDRARLYQGFSFLQVQGSFSLRSRFNEKIFQGVEVGESGIKVGPRVAVGVMVAVAVSNRGSSAFRAGVKAVSAALFGVVVKEGGNVLEGITV